MTRDLPDDMIDAEPAGGWVSEDATPVDGAHVATAAEFQEEAPDEETPRGPASLAPDGERPADPFVESAQIQQGEDPDLSTDDQARG